jgi:hypothetical protein
MTVLTQQSLIQVQLSQPACCVPDSTSGLDVAQNLGDDRADVLQAFRAVQAA